MITRIGSLIHYSTAYMHDEVDNEFAPLLLVSQPLRRLHAGAGARLQHRGAVRRLGGRRPVLVSADWLLVQEEVGRDAREEAFVVNRIGDYAFILGMLALFAQFGTLDIQTIAGRVAGMPVEAGFGMLSMATLLLFIGATGKSAQIPLYTWLPDAMEGPTPVSALIHAATMVTAGVYMIGRNAVLFSHAPETMLIVAVIGATTALMAGTIGLCKNDIKRARVFHRVAARPDVPGDGRRRLPGAGIFHLYTHAFFKALLFLGSGAVIHALHGEQDIRNMGGPEAVPADHLLDVRDRLAGAGRVPGAGGLLQQGRVAVRDLRRGPHRVVGDRADLAADRHLHGQARVPDLLG